MPVWAVLGVALAVNMTPDSTEKARTIGVMVFVIAFLGIGVTYATTLLLFWWIAGNGAPLC